MQRSLSAPRRPRRLLAAGSALTLVFASLDAAAFCRSSTCRGDKCKTDDHGCPDTGTKLFWPTSCVSFSFQKNGTTKLDLDQTHAIVARAFRHWSEVPCPGGGRATMTFVQTADVACKKSEYNASAPNVNVVLFKETDWTYRGIDGTLAKTSVTYNDQTGEIYDADIEINSADTPLSVVEPPKTIKYDLETIMTHEAGHFLGVAHTDDPNAVMYFSYGPGTFQRDLTPDDVDALCAIYPPDRTAACNADPRGGLGASCGGEEAEPSGCALGASVAGSSSELPRVWPAGGALVALAIGLHWRRKRS